MGTAWCQERVEKAQDSKSPFDRVIVRCANQMTSERPRTAQAATRVPPARETQLTTPPPISASGWQEVILTVPDRAPVAPPRRKRANQLAKPARVHAQRDKPPTPVIYLEVDTPTTRHKSLQPEVRTLQPEVTSPPPLKTQPPCNIPGGSSPITKRYLMDLDMTDQLQLPIRRPSSSLSTSSRRSVTSVPEATAERLDNYLKSCRSFGSLKPEELIEEMNLVQSDASSDSDAWAGLDDWDLGISEHYDQRSPLTPTSQLTRRKEHHRANFTVGADQKPLAAPAAQSPRKRTKPSTRRSASNSKPVNFASRPSDPPSPGHLIKPSHIPVQDFLRQASGGSDTSAPVASTKNKFNLKVDVPADNTGVFSFDFGKGLLPPRSPQIEIPGTPNTPRGLSRCSSPLPSQMTASQSTPTPPSSPAAESQHFESSSLLRMLNEYHAVAEIIGDEDVAKRILQGMTDGNVEGHGGSGQSSMTPSLTELEAALSDLLEATQGEDGDEEDEDELKMEATSMFQPIQDKSFAPIAPADKVVETFDKALKKVDKTVTKVDKTVNSVDKVVSPVIKVATLVDKVGTPVDKVVKSVGKGEDPSDKVLAPVKKIVKANGKVLEPAGKVVKPGDKAVNPEITITAENDVEEPEVLLETTTTEVTITVDKEVEIPQGVYKASVAKLIQPEVTSMTFKAENHNQLPVVGMGLRKSKTDQDLTKLEATALLKDTMAKEAH